MSLSYKFKIITLEVDNMLVEVIKDSDQIAYYPSNKSLAFRLKYFTGEMTTFCKIPVRKYHKLNGIHHYDEFKIYAHEQGDEQTKQIKNLGGGALIGAVVAGPIGAAVGAYYGSKVKECPCIITIPSLKIRLNALCPNSYLKEQAKNKFFAEN